MSSFMVDSVHIDVLVHVAIHGPSNGVGTWDKLYFSNQSRSITYDTADLVGAMLIAENLKSINHCYPDTIADPSGVPGPIEQYWLQAYTWTDHRYRLSILEALSALACYEYQSCEHPEWDASEARQFCEALRNRLIHRMPGFEQAPWGWNEDTIRQKQASSTPFILLSSLVRRKQPASVKVPVPSVPVAPVTTQISSVLVGSAGQPVADITAEDIP